MFDTANSYTGGASRAAARRGGRAVPRRGPARQQGLQPHRGRAGRPRAAAAGDRAGAGRDAAPARHRPPGPVLPARARPGRRRSRRPWGRWRPRSRPAGSARSGCSNYAAWQLAEARCLTERSGWPRGARLPAAVQPAVPPARGRVRRVLRAVRHVQHRLQPAGRRAAQRQAHATADRPGARRPLRRRARPDVPRPLLERAPSSTAVDGARARSRRSAGLTLRRARLPVAARPAAGRQRPARRVSSLEQLEANLAAADGPPLGADVLEACDDVWATLRGAAPAYNR